MMGASNGDPVMTMSAAAGGEPSHVVWVPLFLELQLTT
jgi:hypothetical protein